ncbi:MAG: hypothetical protein ACE5HV_04410 [Acidobacteriota bacterium]
MQKFACGLSPIALIGVTAFAVTPAVAGEPQPLSPLTQQTQQEATAQEAQKPAGTEGPLLTPQEEAAMRLVNQILQEEEGALTGTNLSYSAAGRRDPFRSLLAAAQELSAPTVRPYGLPGFMISEVDLKAVARVQGRWHCLLIGPDQKAYFGEVGSELFDGHIMEIGPGEVYFEQQVADLLGARRTRRVVKQLRSLGGS